MIPSPYTSERWPQVPSSEAPSLNMSTKQLARQQSNECCKAPWQTHLVTSGLLESSSTNKRARVPLPHVLQISSPTRPLASYGRHLISIRKSVVPRGAPAALAGFSTTSIACIGSGFIHHTRAWRPARPGRLCAVLLL